MHAIEVSGLRKSFGTVIALDGLDLTVPAGQIVALLGPNGAGKSTTINILLGFQLPDAGSVSVAGVDVAADPVAARRRIAYIPEQVRLYPRLTGRENLEYFHALGGPGGQGGGTGAGLVACLRDAGLSERAMDRPLAEYSKGMRQKVGVAIALARDAPVMLLDEPTSGLDPEAARDFGRSLQMLSERGVGVLMATHDLLRARDVAHRIGILVAGRLVDDQPAAALSAAHLEALYLRRVRPREPA